MFAKRMKALAKFIIVLQFLKIFFLEASYQLSVSPFFKISLTQGLKILIVFLFCVFLFFCSLSMNAFSTVVLLRL